MPARVWLVLSYEVSLILWFSGCVFLLKEARGSLFVVVVKKSHRLVLWEPLGCHLGIAQWWHLWSPAPVPKIISADLMQDEDLIWWLVSALWQGSETCDPLDVTGLCDRPVHEADWGSCLRQQNPSGPSVGKSHRCQRAEGFLPFSS